MADDTDVVILFTGGPQDGREKPARSDQLGTTIFYPYPVQLLETMGIAPIQPLDPSKPRPVFGYEYVRDLEEESRMKAVGVLPEHFVLYAYEGVRQR